MCELCASYVRIRCLCTNLWSTCHIGTSCCGQYVYDLLPTDTAMPFIFPTFQRLWPAATTYCATNFCHIPTYPTTTSGWPLRGVSSCGPPATRPRGLPNRCAARTAATLSASWPAQESTRSSARRTHNCSMWQYAVCVRVRVTVILWQCGVSFYALR